MNKRKLHILIFCILVLLLAIGCSSTDKGQDSVDDILPDPKDRRNKENDESPANEIDPIREQVKGMSIEEKIGQMFMVGLEGYNIDDNSRIMINEHHIGGFIIFGKNVENSSQLLNLINSLKEANSQNNKIPLFISIDEEGGRVSRMPAEIKKFPTSGKIGQMNDKELSYNIGTILGKELKMFGFNMNFAPVLDINSNPQNPVIGDRAFGTEPGIVSELGIQTMKGIQSEGIISVVKHFPGHGDTSVDSHIGLPTIEYDLQRIKEFELVPFREAIENGADVVMVAHILLNQIDPDYPSSLSNIVITDILRKDLGFDGVVISDDMTMGAITENYEVKDAAIKSINAGSDIVLIAHGFDNSIAAINSIKEAVRDGIISEERIDESVYRILKLKKKYNITDDINNSIDVEDINNKIDEVLEKF